MSIELLVDFKVLAQTAHRPANGAAVSPGQTFAFEGDSVGGILLRPCFHLRAEANLADSFTRVVLSDRFRFWPWKPFG
jgi:hypothetical protein